MGLGRESVEPHPKQNALKPEKKGMILRTQSPKPQNGAKDPKP